MAPNFPATGMPPMIGKMLSIAEWRDYVASYDFGSILPTRLVLHHTYVPNESQWRGLPSMQGMQGYYRGLGWSSAPHIYVGPDGIWLFTPMREVGIHAGKGNSGRTNGQFWYSIGLEMVGYFDKTLPKGAVWEGSKAVMGGLSRRLGIAPDKLISFHRDYTNQKSCPGWAITKQWVFGEINAWLNNQAAPPPPPPGPVAFPPPETETLIELLTNESYNKRGEGYNANSALQVFAVEAHMGFPMSKSGQLSADGKTYAYQVYARDTLYCEIPNWGEVRKLSDLLGGSIPPGGLGRALLEATYQASGATFRPDWAFHQFAVVNRVGPPVGQSANITVNGVQYSYQAFALDTLYNVVPRWQEIRLLGDLANTTDPAQVRLRDALLSETYKRGGAEYHADWAFHQLARQWKLGIPISKNYTVTSGATQYAVQVYATDTLYNVVPNWKDVKRLSDVNQTGAAVLSAEEPVLVLGDDTVFQPPAEALPIVRYSTASPAPAVVKPQRSTTELIVLHSDPGPAEARLAALLTPGTRFTPHFYIAWDGTIYQLADETVALKHAGMARWKGRRRNINLNSLAVALERRGGGFHEAQVEALANLSRALGARYRLGRDAVVSWDALRGAANDSMAGFPWEQFRVGES